VARVRPLAQYELENGSKQIVHPLPSLGKNKGALSGPVLEPEVLEVNPPDAEKRWFELDAVFDGTSSQESVYIQSGAQNAVQNDIFRGFNCTILAYGQTGSGKTFTMGTATGSDQLNDSDGVIPRACADLFRTIDERCDGNAKVELSYLEIYNEEIRDLMLPSGVNGEDLRIRETLDGQVYVAGLKSVPVSGPKEIGKFMEQASQRRVVASTKMNAVSSRSHAICVLKIEGVLEDDTKFAAKLTLVDLAGSERIKKTGAEGSRRQEGININKGLFILGQVVSALAEQRPKYKRKPPYRDSKLTRLLQDSLGGNSRTIMVACVSPADFNLDETINTLRYATSARNITNTATRNVIKAISPEEAAKLQRDNQLLSAQVNELQETIRKMSAYRSTTPSLESTDFSELDEHLGEVVVAESEESRRIRELEYEVKQLKSALSKSDGKGKPSISASLVEQAIELPELHRQIACLQEEVEAKVSLEEENERLRHDVEEARADAKAASLAANKLSKIMDQLKELKTDEIDKKQMEHDHIKVEEAWVSFVYQILETNRDQMQKLRQDFYLVARVAGSPDFPVTKDPKDKWWNLAGLRHKNNEDLSAGMHVDPEMRQELFYQHLKFFSDKLIEVENDIISESQSLGSIRDSLRGQRDKLELEIETSGFMRDSLNKDDNELLEQLTSILIGPVKNLGEFS
jgi:Kinesin motor domain